MHSSSADSSRPKKRRKARRIRIVPPETASSTRIRITRLPGVWPVADQKNVK